MENLPKPLVGVLICTYPLDKVIHSLNNWGQMYEWVPAMGLHPIQGESLHDHGF